MSKIPGRHDGTSGAAERQLRQQVAACSLLLNDMGLLGYSGHVSARLPGRNAILIQTRNQPRSSLRPEDLLICDLDGKALAGPRGEIPPSEVFLHTEIMRARPDIGAIAHFHHDRTTAFTMVEGVVLQPVKNHAVRWASGIPVHADAGHVNSPERGRSLAKTLGACHAVLIRAHGQVITAETVPALLTDSVTFIENAEAMFDACQLGRVIPLNGDEIDSFQASLNRDLFVAKMWRYYVTNGQKSGLLPKTWRQI
jgi:L-ribulose-5-phosphate 4-epimerase